MPTLQRQNIKKGKKIVELEKLYGKKGTIKGYPLTNTSDMTLETPLKV